MTTGTAPTETTLLRPDGDTSDGPVEISIVVPALNEKVTIGEFVDWCKEGLARAQVAGEIIIVDSSTDETPAIALAHGARVLRTPKRGLGRAYIDAMPFVRGTYVIMGDCDLTYDFRQIVPFLEKLRAGYDFVMGSRFDGKIEANAMPKLHRYFGTPATTWAFNAVMGTKYGDIHCGMRGMTRDLWMRMKLTSQGWEYASEMVAKAEAVGARSTNVPIDFYRDREGRLSHLKRGGWSTPWRSGWQNLRITFIFGIQRWLVPLAAAAIVFGAALMALLSTGPVMIIPGMTWTLHALFFGVTVFICGVALLHFAILLSVVNDRFSDLGLRWIKRFPYTPSIALGAGLIAVGLVPTSLLVARYVQNHLIITPNDIALSHLSTIGLAAIVAGTLQLSFTFLLHALLDRLSYNP